MLNSISMKRLFPIAVLMLASFRAWGSEMTFVPEMGSSSFSSREDFQFRFGKKHRSSVEKEALSQDLRSEVEAESSLQMPASNENSNLSTIFVQGSPSEDGLFLWNGLELNNPSQVGDGAHFGLVPRVFSSESSVSYGPQTLMKGSASGVLEWKKGKEGKFQNFIGSAGEGLGLIEYQNKKNADHRFGFGVSQLQSAPSSQSSIPKNSPNLETDSYLSSSLGLFSEKKWTSQLGTEVFLGHLLNQQEDDLFGEDSLTATSRLQWTGLRVSLFYESNPKNSFLVERQSLWSGLYNRNDDSDSLKAYRDEASGEKGINSFFWRHRSTSYETSFQLENRQESLSNYSWSPLSIPTPESKFSGRTEMIAQALAMRLQPFSESSPLRGLELNGGLRREVFVSGSNNINWSYELGVKFFRTEGEVFLRWVRNSKDPSLYQLFSRFGDSSLQAQDLDYLESGLQLLSGWSLRLFESLYSSRIDYNFVSKKFENRKKYRIRGVEIAWKKRIYDNEINFSVTRLEARDEDKHKELLRRSPWVIAGIYQWNFKSFWSLQTQVKHLSPRKDQSLQGEVTLPERTDLSIHLSYLDQNSVRHKVSVENALNQAVERTWGYKEVPLRINYTLTAPMMFP